jgi:hypothetical protein
MQKPVPSCPGYFACDEGHIWRFGRKLNANLNSTGYHRITTSIKNVRKDQLVHRLVCEAFNGPGPPGDDIHCRHLDGTRTNNRPENLRWGTRAENEADKERHGTRLWGEQVSRVLTAEKVMEARKRCAEGEQIKDVAAEFAVKDHVLADAVTGRRWRRLPDAIVPYSTKRKLRDEQVLAIRARGNSETRLRLAAEFGVSQNAIFQVLHRKTYTHL